MGTASCCHIARTTFQALPPGDELSTTYLESSNSVAVNCLWLPLGTHTIRTNAGVYHNIGLYKPDEELVASRFLWQEFNQSRNPAKPPVILDAYGAGASHIIP